MNTVSKTAKLVKLTEKVRKFGFNTPLRDKSEELSPFLDRNQKIVLT